MANNLRILYLNANHRKVAMDHLLATAQQVEADVICITEPYPDKGKIQAAGWRQFRKDRSAILTRPDIPVLSIPVGTPETTCVALGDLSVVCTYASPSQLIQSTVDPLLADIRQLPPRVLLVGDFNCRTAAVPGCRTNPRGRIFEAFLDDSQLTVQNPPTPTWSRRGDEGVNDYVCTKNIQVPKVEVLAEAESLSDHRYIIIEATTATERKAAPKKLDKERLKHLLRRHTFTIPPLRNPAEIDMFVAELTGTLQDYLEESSIPGRSQNHQQLRWWTKELEKVRQVLHRLRRLKRQCADIIGRAVIDAMRIKMTAIYKRLMQDEKVKAFRRFISSKTPWGKPYKVFKYLSQRRDTPSLRRPDGSRCKNLTENAELLLQSKFPEVDDDWPRSCPVAEGPPDEVSAEKIGAIIRKLNNRKAPGPDVLPNGALKLLHLLHPHVLRSLFTACLVHGHFPSAWKTGRVVFIPKPGKDLELPASHRPITLLSCLGKVFERVMNDLLTEHLSATEALHPNQFGFRLHVGTEDALHHAMGSIERCRVENRYTAVLSCDIKGAFDNLLWSRILTAPPMAGVAHSVWRCLNEYLKDRIVCTTGLNRQLSTGCPQGSVLGPTMWNVAHDGVLRGMLGCCNSVTCFADDTLLVVGSSSLSHLSRRCRDVLKQLEDLLAVNGLELNTAKTEVLLYCGGTLAAARTSRQNFTIQTAGGTLRPVDTMKYLGVLVNSDGKWEPHIKGAVERCNRSLPLLTRLCQNLCGYSNRARRIMTKGAIYPHLFYCCTLFYQVLWKRANRGLIIEVQRQCDRICLRAYRTISGDAASVLNGTPPIDLLLTKRSVQWLERKRLPVPYRGIFPASLDADNEPQWRKEIHTEWERRWAVSTKGAWTRQLFPTVESRLKTAIVANFDVTQGLCGHGTFGSYLHQYRRRDSASCSCGAAVQTPEHVFRECTRFAANRPATLRPVTMAHLRYFGEVVRALREEENPLHELRPAVPAAPAPAVADGRPRRRRAPARDDGESPPRQRRRS